MSGMLEKLKKEVFGDFFYTIDTIDPQTYNALPSEEKRYYDVDGSNYSRRVPVDIPEEEEQRIINLRMLQLMEKAEKNISKMKSILTFWLVLSILSLLGIIISFIARIGS